MSKVALRATPRRQPGRWCGLPGHAEAPRFAGSEAINAPDFFADNAISA